MVIRLNREGRDSSLQMFDLKFNFEKASSIGLKSGEYGGRKWTIDPTSSIMLTIACL